MARFWSAKVRGQKVIDECDLFYCALYESTEDQFRRHFVEACGVSRLRNDCGKQAEPQNDWHFAATKGLEDILIQPNK